MLSLPLHIFPLRGSGRPAKPFFPCLGIRALFWARSVRIDAIFVPSCITQDGHSGYLHNLSFYQARQTRISQPRPLRKQFITTLIIPLYPPNSVATHPARSGLTTDRFRTHSIRQGIKKYHHHTASMRLTSELIQSSLSYLNPLKERELDLRGAY